MRAEPNKLSEAPRLDVVPSTRERFRLWRNLPDKRRYHTPSASKCLPEGSLVSNVQFPSTSPFDFRRTSCRRTRSKDNRIQPFHLSSPLSVQERALPYRTGSRTAPRSRTVTHSVARSGPAWPTYTRLRARRTQGLKFHSIALILEGDHC